MERKIVPLNSTKVILAASALVGTLALAGCSEQKPPAPRAATSVSVVTVDPAEISAPASLSGEIKARVQQDAAFRTGGRISEILVDVGDHVVADQLLAKLDPREQQANVQLSAATVASAEAQVTQAKANFDRQDSLLKQGFTTRAKFDAAQTALTTAQGSLDAAKAQLASANELVTYTELRAAADGIIVARSVESDQVIQAAQPILTIAQDGARDAVFEISEAALTEIPHDTSVGITLIANSAISATGHVREIAPNVNTATGTVRVKVGLDATTPDMPLGAAITGAVNLPATTAFVLPWSALYSDAHGPAVWIVDPASNTVSTRPVTVGRYLADSVVVTAGLEPGDHVVSRGLQLLRPGQSVAMTEEAAK